MSNRKPQPDSGVRKTLRRLFLSAFVVVSFVAYALHKPTGQASGSAQGDLSNPSGSTAGQAPVNPTSPAQTDPAAQQSPPTDTPYPEPSNTSPTATPQQPSPTAPPPLNTTASASSAAYKDGNYTGPQVDAYYGLVQVQATVQGGKLANVQFLQYPNDRRTSVRINSYAVPVLQQEAIQAQNANVDIITGATLTSQAFAESLQTALDQAKR